MNAARATAINPGWRKPLSVLVRINGQPASAWRINMMPVGNGSFYLYLHGNVRKDSSASISASRDRHGLDLSIFEFGTCEPPDVYGVSIAARGGT